MSFAEDFKKFAFKGNVVDLAVGVVIGAAFGKIVVGARRRRRDAVGRVRHAERRLALERLVLRHAAVAKDDIVLKYGDFMGAVVDFFIVAFVLFVLVSRIIKAAEARLDGPAPAALPVTKDCRYCYEPVPP